MIDATPRADQPMRSACGRYTIVFNGEIYNHRELAAALSADGVVLRTRSDVEVVLELFAREGAAMLARLRGMFAFVVWDAEARCATAARDPYGIKPLYYTPLGDGIVFASQVRALLAHPAVPRTEDPQAMAEHWVLGSVAEPRTWFVGIRALRAGHLMTVRDGAIEEDRCWADLGAVWRDGSELPNDGAEVPVLVRGAVRRSVEAHLVADVPVGLLLSGGIDSAALASTLAALGRRDVVALTLAYPEFEHGPLDESSRAAEVARRFGLTHRIRRVTREEFESDRPSLLAAMDQPSVDGVNAWFAGKAARELGIKALLTGAGGDELFEGYPSFRRVPAAARAMACAQRLPGGVRVASYAAGLVSRATGDVRWRQAVARGTSAGALWLLTRQLDDPAALEAAVGAPGPFEVRDAVDGWLAAHCGALAADPRLAVGQLESTLYLRNQLLRDLDWATMAHGVEARTPFVDHQLSRELAPMLRAFGRFPAKSMLTAALEPALPSEVVRHPKTGFRVPIGAWTGAAGSDRDPGAVSRRWSRQVVAGYRASIAR